MLTFGTSFFDWTPEVFPLSSSRPGLIALFWDDHDVRNNGEILFRFSNETSLLNEVGFIITTEFEQPFYPDTLFIATWNGVARYGGGSLVNFECHLKMTEPIF